MNDRFLQTRLADPRGARRPVNAGAWLLVLSFAATLVLAQLDTNPDEPAIEHTVIRQPIDHIGKFADDADPVSIKWSRAAMHDPRTASQLRENFKTPEQKQNEADALLAITDPETYRKRKEETQARRPKTPAEQEADARAERDRARALRAILNPIEVARELEPGKTDAVRQREAIAADAILNPREFNERVNRHKSQALRQREADALLALSQPEALLQERQRSRKAATKPLSKTAQGDPSTVPISPAQPNTRPNRTEKGANNP